MKQECIFEKEETSHWPLRALVVSSVEGPLSSHGQSTDWELCSTFSREVVPAMVFLKIWAMQVKASKVTSSALDKILPALCSPFSLT